MKINFTTALLAITCLTASAHGYAQSTLRANIPFEFTVGQKVLPAGSYSISKVSDRVVELYNWEKNARMFVSMTATGYVSQQPRLLVFREYGDQYFLREVRGGLGEFSLDVSPSKLEKETQRQASLAHARQQNAEIALNALKK
jgi:hypothetical protein